MHKFYVSKLGLSCVAGTPLGTQDITTNRKDKGPALLRVQHCRAWEDRQLNTEICGVSGGHDIKGKKKGVEKVSKVYGFREFQLNNHQKNVPEELMKCGSNKLFF